MKRACILAAGVLLTWAAALVALLVAARTVELLAWQPLHRGEYEAARPLLEARVALTRTAMLLGAPRQDLRLAASLGDLADAVAETGEPARAKRLYRESIERFRAELGSRDARTKYARWRYDVFLRAHGHTPREREP